ncbi:hypothetical protein EDB89DRAFT_1009856, partial [Lactarius sanguifluus]
MLFISPTHFFLLSLPVSVLSVANSTDTNTDTCDPSHNGLATGTLQYNSDWTNFRLVILPVRVEEAGNASNFLQNVRSRSSVRTKDRNVPRGFKLDSRVNSTVTTRVLGPDDFKDLRDTTGRGLNVNGSICLNFVCQFANITAGST